MAFPVDAPWPGSGTPRPRSVLHVRDPLLGGRDPVLCNRDPTCCAPLARWAPFHWCRSRDAYGGWVLGWAGQQQRLRVAGHQHRHTRHPIVSQILSISSVRVFVCYYGPSNDGKSYYMGLISYRCWCGAEFSLLIVVAGIILLVVHELGDMSSAQSQLVLRFSYPQYCTACLILDAWSTNSFVFNMMTTLLR